MKLILYRIYQLVILAPVALVTTILAAFVTAIGSAVFGGRWWGYWPAHWWARIICLFTPAKITVSGRENIVPGRSYVFVANHQGAYDIFAVYGYLNHNFKWMMKRSLERIPLVGLSCRIAGHIFVDNSSRTAVKETMQAAERQLADGMSVVVFPEGSRTRDGKVHAFRRGAYILAEEFGLPVVPVTIDGAYQVMPRTSWLPKPGHIKLTIHRPIEAQDGRHELKLLMEESKNAILSSLPADCQ